MFWILTSGLDSLPLVKLCQQSETPFCIIADNEGRPYQDKDPERLIERTKKLVKKAEEIWCTYIIASPIQELLIKKEDIDRNRQDVIIIPLFQSYLNHCLEHSLVGKIWFVGWYSDLCLIESLFPDIAKNYILTDNQKTTKRFQVPLSKRCKDTSMRNYFLRLFSPRQLLINKTIKEDLRYFKDANIDTLIPLSYSYFNYQRTITSYFNQKKQKFHKRDTVEKLFNETTKKETLWSFKMLWTLQLYYTWSSHLFTNHKKVERLLSQGKINSIEYKKINLSE